MNSRITDPIYGDFEIDEPVILDLLECQAFTRLSGIDQGGYMRVHFPGAEYTRQDHSIGVFLLLRMFGASLEEQIAGLLHDVSHTVFSHSADYAVDEGSGARQDLQDNSHRDCVLNSEIPDILSRHGFDVERILNEDNFPLLENELPDVCADRIDYMLRSAVHASLITSEEAEDILATLCAEQGRWFFADEHAARGFAELFAFVNHTLLSGFPSAVMLGTVGDALRRAMEIGAVSREDLFSTDTQVLEKMRRAAKSDAEMRTRWNRMNLETLVLPDFNGSPAFQVECKSRMVDPLFRKGAGEIIRLSDLYEGWKDRVERESKTKVFGLRFPDGGAA